MFFIAWHCAVLASALGAAAFTFFTPTFQPFLSGQVSYHGWLNSDPSCLSTVWSQFHSSWFHVDHWTSFLFDKCPYCWSYFWCTGELVHDRYAYYVPLDPELVTCMTILGSQVVHRDRAFSVWCFICLCWACRVHFSSVSHTSFKGHCLLHCLFTEYCGSHVLHSLSWE